MVGIIHRCNINIKLPPNPDDYFDPSTHIATEANFIAFLEAGGKYDDTSLIGYKVVLSNTAAYNNSVWIIADINHDSSNTGQENCYDLISQDNFNPMVFGNNHNWRDSTVRSWLNDTFYSGFSADFKAHILNPKYNSQGLWYTDDKIILPSQVEVNGGTSDTDNEGLPYPIYTDDASRKKLMGGWWLRSRYIYGSSTSYACAVQSTGAVSSYGTRANNYVAPILRVS